MGMWSEADGDRSVGSLAVLAVSDCQYVLLTVPPAADQPDLPLISDLPASAYCCLFSTLQLPSDASVVATGGSRFVQKTIPAWWHNNELEISRATEAKKYLLEQD